MLNRAAEQQAIHERRQKVAALRLGGVRDCRTIAKQLGVSRNTINKDIHALDAQWQAEAADCIAREKALDLQRLERAIRAIWPQVLEGKLWAIDRLISLLDRKAKLLGLDAPKRIDITQEVRNAAAELGLDPDEAVRIADEYVRSLNVGLG